MSVESSNAPVAGEALAIEDCPDVELIIEPRRRDLGGFVVGRVLPFAKRRMVGPFVFFDEMGPAAFAPGSGIDVRPHPHIGLATVTYLFDGEIQHKDSLGFDLPIRPGDINWMTAGRGIAHSERTPAAVRAAGHRLHGIQSWVALPEEAEETAPAFHHHPGASLPQITRGGLSLRLLAGEAFGAASPVKTFSSMFYAAVDAEAGTAIPLPDGFEERALYLVSGAVSINATPVAEKRMLVFRPDARPEITASAPSRLMLLGGAPIGPRHIWWNLVSTRQERIEEAKRAWAASAEAGFRNAVFSLPPGESEHIPLPEA